jgi:hypothetical protein
LDGVVARGVFALGISKLLYRDNDYVGLPENTAAHD